MKKNPLRSWTLWFNAVAALSTVVLPVIQEAVASNPIAAIAVGAKPALPSGIAKTSPAVTAAVGVRSIDTPGCR